MPFFVGHRASGVDVDAGLVMLIEDAMTDETILAITELEGAAVWRVSVVVVVLVTVRISETAIVGSPYRIAFTV